MTVISVGYNGMRDIRGKQAIYNKQRNVFSLNRSSDNIADANYPASSFNDDELDRRSDQTQNGQDAYFEHESQHHSSSHEVERRNNSTPEVTADSSDPKLSAAQNSFDNNITQSATNEQNNTQLYDGFSLQRKAVTPITDENQASVAQNNADRPTLSPLRDDLTAPTEMSQPVLSIENEPQITQENRRQNEILSILTDGKKKITVTVTGLGFDEELLEKALSISPHINIGLANPHGKYLKKLQSVPNAVLFYLSIHDRDNPEVPGISGKLSEAENIKRILSDMESFEKINGIYFDINQLLSGNVTLASAIFKVIKRNDLVLLNSNMHAHYELSQKLNESLPSFVSNQLNIGYNNHNKEQVMIRLNNFLYGSEEEFVSLIIPATHINLQGLSMWLNSLNYSHYTLAEISLTKEIKRYTQYHNNQNNVDRTMF